MQQLEKGNNKVMNAWAFYDWANSVYSLVISSSIFPLYFGFLFTKENPNIDIFGTSIKATSLIFFITAFAFLTVAVLSPILSGIADYLGNKKRFMQFFCYLGAASCIGLYWFTKENIVFGMCCFYFGLVGFWGSLVFYNSYLSDIAFTEQHDKLSAKGFSLGYVGSVILLVICLYLIIGSTDEEAIQAMKLSFVFTGIWWIAFSQYTFYYLPKGNKNKHPLTFSVVLNGYDELKKVQKLFFKDATLKRFLIAFFIYSMAVQTVMLVATYFGEQEINWGTADEKRQGLIVSILMIQLVAVLGAILTSKLALKFGNIKTLIGINSVWIFICIGAFFVTKPIQFYLVAGIVGLVMGGIQSLSRSTFSKLMPETNDTTSFFSFYDVAEKIGIVIGMLLYGSINQISGSMRNAILFLVLFFAIGVVLLFRTLKVQK
ncbi:MFS transporter [Flavobacterium sp.]|uniref:MFS transporter n=1 Tax=Flavobacterium sp. TaxID=239 RepID=UPI001B6F360C|nr:MFS transporter [Flavobacterium sp.]MBP6128227.1 MFS transporter [Flavobacterium sp.]